jgi:hypothetical protein
MDKKLPGAPHETLLVLDATTGMNALNQAREFHKAVKLTGLVITKLDGTSKGGMVVAIQRELGCRSNSSASANRRMISSRSTRNNLPKRCFRRRGSSVRGVGLERASFALTVLEGQNVYSPPGA